VGGETREAAIRPQEPLAREEMEPLWRWERQVSWLNIAAMVAFLLAGAIGYRDGTLAWLARPLLAAALGFLLVAGLWQFRVRCPRCRARLRSKIIKLLPDKCAACGVELPRPPSAKG
jgi:hypothetical protein